MNKLEIDGRLTRDGEVKYTSNGKGVIKFTIAQTERKKQGDQWVDDGSSFYDCEYWLHDHDDPARFSKGQIIHIEGKLKQDQWEKDGKKQSKVKIVVKEVLGWDWANAANKSNSGPVSTPQKAYSPPSSDKFEDDNPNDPNFIPF